MVKINPKFAKKAGKVAGEMIKENVKSAGAEFGKKAGNTTKKAIGKTFTMNDKRGANWANGWTGKKLNGYTIGALGVAGVVAYHGGPNAVFGEQRPNEASSANYNFSNMGKITAPKLGNQPITYSQSPSTMADGLIEPERDLGANGAMVFGMHNKRHG